MSAIIVRDNQAAAEQRADLLNELQNFTGSERFFLCSLSKRNVMTEGAKYVAEKTGGFWLMDIISSWQIDKRTRNEDFQVWTVYVFGDNRGLVVCEDGHNREICRQELAHTDFPLGLTSKGFSVWAERNELGGVTIMLPSER